MSFLPSTSPVPHPVAADALEPAPNVQETRNTSPGHDPRPLEHVPEASTNGFQATSRHNCDRSEATTPHKTKWAKHRQRLSKLKSIDRRAPRAKGELVREFSQEQARRLLGLLERPIQDIIATSFRTGIFVGQLLDLTKNNVDYLKGEIFLPTTEDYSARYVGICETTLTLFDELKVTSPNSRYIFCHNDGNSICFEEVEAAFLVACERLDLHGQLLTDIPWSYAAWLVDAGFPGPLIAARLGVGKAQVQYRFTRRLRKPQLGLKGRHGLSLEDKKLRGSELEKSRKMTLEMLETFIKL